MEMNFGLFSKCFQILYREILIVRKNLFHTITLSSKSNHYLFASNLICVINVRQILMFEVVIFCILWLMHYMCTQVGSIQCQLWHFWKFKKKKIIYMMLK